MTEPLFFQRLSLSHKAVMIQCLDAAGKEIDGAYASGFILRESDGLFLYTCWHVVTGLDIHYLPMNYEAPNRRVLRISLQDSAEQPTGGKLRAFVIDGLRNLDVPLYELRDGRDIPVWHQDPVEETTDLKVVKIVVPHRHDAVKLRLPKSFDTSPLHVVEWADLNNGLIFPGDRIYIVGFPYRFSARGEDQPIPVIVTRFVAGTQIKGRIGEFLIDGVGAPGMSGGPVYIERDGQILLVGLYKGTVYTAGEENRREPIGALGACVDMSSCWTHAVAALRPLGCPPNHA